MTNSKLLRVSGLSYRESIKNISMALSKGEILALLGPNGSGKTTFLKLIAGILPPSRGSVFFNSSDVTSYSPSFWAEKIQYVGPTLKADFPIRVSEVLGLGDFRKRSRLPTSNADSEAILEASGCESLHDKLLQELSSGELSRVAFAQALIQKPALLLLDESFSFMDLDYQARMGSYLQKLANQGLSIILVAHDFNFATEWASQVLFLKDGQKFAQGSLEEKFTQEILSGLYPHSPLKVVSGPSGRPKVFFGNTRPSPL